MRRSPVTLVPVRNMKNLKLIRLAGLVFCCVVLLCCAVQAARPALSAECAVLLDADTGEVLYEKNAAQQHLIASTTKIMTGYLVVRHCDPDQVVRVAPEACGVEGSSLYLKAGEELTIRELLYGLMLRSGNDAAVALAIACSGSVEAFVQLMNQTAGELGLHQTHFANPNGLDAPDHFSTALDLARLTAAALREPLFAEVVSTKETTISERSLQNHNKMLWRYDGADGVKTGFTKAAGRALVSSASRNGRQLIAVTLNAPDDWDDHTQLLDYGFATFDQQVTLEKGQQVSQLPVLGGVQPSCPLVLADSVTLALRSGEQIQVRVRGPLQLFAPLHCGDWAATGEICINGHPVAVCQLEAGQSIETEKPAESSGWKKFFGTNVCCRDYRK